MLRNLAFIVGYAVILVLSTSALFAAADFGTPEEAKAMLEKAVAAVKTCSSRALLALAHALVGGDLSGQSVRGVGEGAVLGMAIRGIYYMSPTLPVQPRESGY